MGMPPDDVHAAPWPLLGVGEVVVSVAANENDVGWSESIVPRDEITPQPLGLSCGIPVWHEVAGDEHQVHLPPPDGG